LKLDTLSFFYFKGQFLNFTTFRYRKEHWMEMEKIRHRDDTWSIVITEGDLEPWYFLEGWEKQIKEQLSFSSKAEAVYTFKELIQSYRQRFQHCEIRDNAIACFWNEGDEVYCEACDDYVQIFHGIILLYSDKMVQPRNITSN